jgi:hypothetical protein
MASSVASNVPFDFTTPNIDTLASLTVDIRRIATARRSVSDPGDGWNPCDRCDPPVIGLELQAELVVEDP